MTVYYLKRPKGARRTFAIIGRQADGSQPTVKSETLAALNAALKRGAIGLADADFQAAALVSHLNSEEKKKRGKYSANEANSKLLSEYWRAVYSRRKLRAPESARYRLARALAGLGATSVLGAASEVQRAIDKACSGKPRRQRNLAAAINQLRRHFGLNEPIALELRARPKFRYLSEPEFLAVLGRAADSDAPLFGSLFYTGTRVSECFGLEHFRRGIVVVEGQLDRRGVEKPTKTNRVRKAVVPPQGHRFVEAWLESARNVGSRDQAAKRFRALCKRAFPADSSKWLTLRDLRHCYAVLMLSRYEVSLSTIARMLGNSEAVCEEYYLNFVPEDDALLSVLAKVRK